MSHCISGELLNSGNVYIGMIGQLQSKIYSTMAGFWTRDLIGLLLRWKMVLYSYMTMFCVTFKRIKSFVGMSTPLMTLTFFEKYPTWFLTLLKSTVITVETGARFCLVLRVSGPTLITVNAMCWRAICTAKNAQPVPGWWKQASTMLCCTPWTMHVVNNMLQHC